MLHRTVGPKRSITVRDRESVRARESLHDWGNWANIYRQLLSQGRIWDFHDIYVTAIHSYGVDQTLETFFGHESHDDPKALFDRLVGDWTTAASEADEATQLALLDILSVTILQLMVPQDSSLIRTCLKVAEAIGGALMTCFPNSIRSRPFFHWALAKAAFLARTDLRRPLTDHFSGYPGLTFYPYCRSLGSRLIWLPCYTPVRDENPGLPILNVPPRRKDSLEAILRAARELQDYHIEALCLGELILQSKDRYSYFDGLATLQKSTQDSLGYLCTCISKYLVCKDEQDKARLLADLAEVGWWDNNLDDLIFPQWAASRDIIQKALSKHKTDGNSMSAGIKYQQALPEWFCSAIIKHTPIGEKPTNPELTAISILMRRQSDMNLEEPFVASNGSNEALARYASSTNKVPNEVFLPYVYETSN